VVVLSVLKLLGIVLNTALMAPPFVVAGMIDGRWAYRVARVWVRVNLLVSGVRIRSERQVALDPHATFVFMSNHQSHFDVLAVVAALPEFQLRWVAKQELTKVPIFGWALRHSDHIIIDRSDHARAMATLRAAVEKMRRGLCVIIFPEGTRGPGDGTLLPFKKSGFVLAMESGMPIVPIAVRGSRNVLGRHGWQIHGGEIDVLVDAPMAVAGRDRDELMGQVRERLETMVPGAPAASPVPVRLAEVR
jgi:1-acyl-sn-glycerol-3-phosphate acyltransferase